MWRMGCDPDGVSSFRSKLSQHGWSTLMSLTLPVAERRLGLWRMVFATVEPQVEKCVT